MTLGQLLRPLFRQIAIDPSGGTLFGSSAIEHWPRESLAGIQRARLIEPGPNADAQICPGCAQACVLALTFISEGGFIQCNQADVDHGLIELEPTELRQWHTSRSRVVAFVARELKLSPDEQDDRAVRIHFGTWAGAGLRRAMALEFNNSAILRIGDAQIDLSELVKWDGERVRIDREELDIRASQSSDLQTGGKRYQHSQNKQRHRTEFTKLRNLRMQEKADQLKRRHPAMKKGVVAKELVASGEFGTTDHATIERIIRVPRKKRRKNFT